LGADNKGTGPAARGTNAAGKVDQKPKSMGQKMKDGASKVGNAIKNAAMKPVNAISDAIEHKYHSSPLITYPVVAGGMALGAAQSAVKAAKKAPGVIKNIAGAIGAKAKAAITGN